MFFNHIVHSHLLSIALLIIIVVFHLILAKRPRSNYCSFKTQCPKSKTPLFTLSIFSSQIFPKDCRIFPLDINIFLIFYKNCLFVNKSTFNNDNYHFLRIHSMPGTLLRTLFFKLFSVKVDTSSIFPTSHTWKMGLREVVHCSVSIADKWRSQPSNLCVSDTKVHALTTGLYWLSHSLQRLSLSF